MLIIKKKNKEKIKQKEKAQSEGRFCPFKLIHHFYNYIAKQWAFVHLFLYSKKICQGKT